MMGSSDFVPSLRTHWCTTTVDKAGPTFTHSSNCRHVALFLCISTRKLVPPQLKQILIFFFIRSCLSQGEIAYCEFVCRNGQLGIVLRRLIRGFGVLISVVRMQSSGT